MKKIIVAGSRKFTNKKKVFQVLGMMHSNGKKFEIVSGLAKGPDMFGKEWGDDHGIKVHEFPANWDKYGKKAGYLRNEQMAEFADALIAFWDGESRGTMHMIDLAKKHGLKVVIITT